MNISGFTAEASLYKSDERISMSKTTNGGPQVFPHNVVYMAINCRACIEAGGECLCGGRGCFCV